MDRLEDWRELRKLVPHRRGFGVKRGACIDRFYIEQFLAENAVAIRGHVGEGESDQDTRQFGSGGDKVEGIDINESNDRRTMTLGL